MVAHDEFNVTQVTASYVIGIGDAVEFFRQLRINIQHTGWAYVEPHAFEHAAHAIIHHVLRCVAVPINIRGGLKAYFGESSLSVIDGDEGGLQINAFGHSAPFFMADFAGEAFPSFR